MRNQAAKYQTDKGWIVVTRDGITTPNPLQNILAGLVLAIVRRGTWKAIFRQNVIPAAEVARVQVTGRDRQYMTGGRAAGVVLTGGVALLAPTRVRGALVITTAGGDVHDYTLQRRDAQRPEAVAAQLTALGYPVA